jgi:transcriptional regulator with XRE-family HTH domain
LASIRTFVCLFHDIGEFYWSGAISSAIMGLPELEGQNMTSLEPTVRRQELGRELRTLRKAAGFTLEDAGQVINCSASKVSRIETGHRAVTPVEVSALVAVYSADVATRDRLLALAEEASEVGWWQSRWMDVASSDQTLIALESKAEMIVHFDVTLVPGILQTSEYTRAIMSQTGMVPKEEIEDRMLARLRRNSVLLRPDPPELVAIIDELALRRLIGGRDVVRRQLECLVKESQRPNVTLRVVPNDGPVHSGVDGSFVVVRRSGLSPVIVVESLTSSLFLEDQRDVDAYELALRNLLARALGAEQSVAMVADLAKQLDTEASNGWRPPTYAR